MHPRAFLFCQRLHQTLSLASYIVPCQLSFKHLALSPALLHRCHIAGSLDQVSRRIQRLKDGGNVKLSCVTYLRKQGDDSGE
jgi:hypothetical protein